MHWANGSFDNRGLVTMATNFYWSSTLVDSIFVPPQSCLLKRNDTEAVTSSVPFRQPNFLFVWNIVDIGLFSRKMKDLDSSHTFRKCCSKGPLHCDWVLGLLSQSGQHPGCLSALWPSRKRPFCFSAHLMLLFALVLNFRPIESHHLEGFRRNICGWNRIKWWKTSLAAWQRPKIWQVKEGIRRGVPTWHKKRDANLDSTYFRIFNGCPFMCSFYEQQKPCTHRKKKQG